MKANLLIPFLLSLLLLSTALTFNGCRKSAERMPSPNAYKIIFLHHSTGMTVWKGATARFEKIKKLFGVPYDVPAWFDNYNKDNNKEYIIKEQSFPKGEPYPWNNYPYDYYNIWVKNAGNKPYEEEPTLEMLTGEYDMIIFKHCFPVSHIQQDIGKADIESSDKRLENYKLQYAALKDKMHSFPETKFIVWTGAANVKNKTTPEYAALAREFVDWVIDEWDEPGDNIFLWDFNALETEGTLYLKDEYARNPGNSHPDPKFTSRIAPLFCQRIVDVIETNGQKTSLTGNMLH